jgi:hypothetical protein
MSPRDKMYLMKLPARVVLSAVIISVGLLSPIMPSEMPGAVSQQADRCAYQVTSSQCCRSQSQPAASSSAMRSNCCSGQVCCVVLYVVSAACLLDPILAGERIGEITQHASARTQRPPVPPPRVEFSPSDGSPRPYAWSSFFSKNEKEDL